MMDWIANVMFNFGAFGMFVCALVMVLGAIFGGRWA
jgi:hypothetical protein